MWCYVILLTRKYYNKVGDIKYVTFKTFIQQQQNISLLFGPADLGNIIMLSQVVQVAIEILQKNKYIYNIC